MTDPATSSSEVAVLWGRSGRKEAIVLRACRVGGVEDALTVAIDDRGVASAFVARALDAAAVEELTGALAAATGSPLRPLALEEGQLLLARALLRGLACGRPWPHAVDEAWDIVGDMAPWLGRVDDLYTCAECGDGLSGEAQVALASGDASGDEPWVCRRCVASGGPCLDGLEPSVARSLARAALLAAAGQPRRALAFAATAEDEGASADAIHAVRGAAHLEIGNAVQAAVHLRQAVAARPWDAHALALLVAAEASCGLVASATASLDALVGAAPQTRPHADPVRVALSTIGDAGGEGAARLEAACLEAMTLLEAGEADRARHIVESLRGERSDHPGARLLDTLLADVAHAHAQPPSSRLVAHVQALTGQTLPRALGALTASV